jgi:hypothetical protein
MGMYMKEIGLMIKLMALEHTHMLMGLNILVNGTLINSTELDLKAGQMEQNMRESIVLERSMALGS